MLTKDVAQLVPAKLWDSIGLSSAIEAESVQHFFSQVVFRGYERFTTKPSKTGRLTRALDVARAL